MPKQMRRTKKMSRSISRKRVKAEFMKQLKASGGDRIAAINAALDLVPFSQNMSEAQRAQRKAVADIAYKLRDTVSYPLPKHAEMRAKYHEETRRPGKFEGEPAYTPYFYEHMMEGGGEMLRNGDERFHVTAEDRDIFPELKGKRNVTLHVRDDGFVVAD